MRKLASIRIAGDINVIEGADNIVMVNVDGWQCVVKKEEFKPGDIGVYFEIDSFIPGSDERFKFLENKFHTYDGKVGLRLRTIKLRGQISQGLFLPVGMFEELKDKQVGDDVSEVLGIEKWEPPVTPVLAGHAKGVFPYFLKKTDEERCQNLVSTLENMKGQEFEMTVKLDGSSTTAYVKDEEYGVCSRNLELKEMMKMLTGKWLKNTKLLKPFNLLVETLLSKVN